MCMVNSCCSIFFEVMFNYLVLLGFEVCSVGSQFSGWVYLCSLVIFEQVGIVIYGLYSKGSEVFEGVLLDIVIIVCDVVVGEVCLLYFGVVLKVYWGLVDFFVLDGDEVLWDVVFYVILVCIEQCC